MAAIKFVRLCGWVGLIGACLVGLGEYLLQYTSNGGYEKGYAFLAEVSQSRQTLGHFIAVLAAPLYLMGYWHLAFNIDPRNGWIRKLFFCLGAYGFVIGTAWISQRVFLALTSHEIAEGQNLASLQMAFADHNEPLINVLRIAMAVLSIIWIAQITKGKSNYPKWMAIFSPLANASYGDQLCHHSKNWKYLSSHCHERCAYHYFRFVALDNAQTFKRLEIS